MNEPIEPQGVPNEIRELLAQRTTYEDWLRKLDEVGAEYRPDVAERVRSDYRKRLGGVSEELEGHRHELEASLQARRRRMQELTDSFDGQSAELEEAELRHKVGEYDDGTWEEKRTSFTEALEEIELELDGARGAVGELEDVLGRLGSADLTEVLTKNGVPWVGSTKESPGEAKVLRGETTKPVASGERRAAREEPPRTASRDEKEAPAAAAVTAAAEAEGETDAGDAPASVEAAATRGRPATSEGEETGGGAKRDRREEDRAGPKSATAAGELEDAEQESREGAEPPDDYLDELEFLESLSLDDPDSFDAVSRMLEDEEDR